MPPPSPHDPEKSASDRFLFRQATAAQHRPASIRPSKPSQASRPSTRAYLSARPIHGSGPLPLSPSSPGPLPCPRPTSRPSTWPPECLIYECSLQRLLEPLPDRHDSNRQHDRARPDSRRPGASWSAPSVAANSSENNDAALNGDASGSTRDSESKTDFYFCPLPHHCSCQSRPPVSFFATPELSQKNNPQPAPKRSAVVYCKHQPNHGASCQSRGLGRNYG